MTEPADVMAYREGVRLFKEGKTLEALEKFKFAAQTGEDRPMEHFALAAAYVQMGQLEGAEKEYRFFLDMTPGLPQQEAAARKALAGIERRREKERRQQEAAARERRREEERQRLEEVRKLFQEALAFFRGGGADSALTRLETLAQRWGRTAEVLNLMGLCHKKLGDPDAALAALEEARQAAPENTDVALNLAQLYFEEGINRSLPLVEQVVGRHPERASAWYNLGIVALAAGDFERARHAWQKVLDLDPADETARANLEMIARRIQ